MKEERKKAFEVISDAMKSDYLMVNGVMVMVDKMSINYIEKAMYEDDKDMLFQISLWAKYSLVGRVIAYHKFILANYEKGCNIRPLDNVEKSDFMEKIIEYCERKCEEEK